MLPFARVWVVGLGLAMIGSLGCARYDVVRDHLGPDCRNRVGPVRSGPPIDTVHVDTFPPGTVSGHVRAEGRPDGLDHARVTLRGRAQHTVRADSAGYFAFADV